MGGTASVPSEEIMQTDEQDILNGHQLNEHDGEAYLQEEASCAPGEHTTSSGELSQQAPSWEIETLPHID